MPILLLIFSALISFARADVERAVVRALAAYEFAVTPDCRELLDQDHPDLGTLRDPAGLKAALERFPRATLLRGDLGQSYGVFIAAFPGRNPGRLSFTLLYLAPVPWLLRYEDEFGRMIEHKAIDWALAPCDEHPTKSGPYVVDNIRGPDGLLTPAYAAIKTQFSLDTQQAMRETVERVARELLDWDERVRTAFYYR